MISNRAFIAAHRARLAGASHRLSTLSARAFAFSPMTSRIKAPSLESKVEFERCVDDLARTTVALRRLEARRDEKIQAIRAEWEPAVNEAASRIKAMTLLVDKYAHEHREELLPGKAKSAETPLAVFGFRLGQPTLRLLSRSWTWDKVIASIKTRIVGWQGFVRTREEPDKEALKKLPNGQLAEIGLRIDQEEAFFVEPKDQPTAAELAKLT